MNDTLTFKFYFLQGTIVKKKPVKILLINNSHGIKSGFEYFIKLYAFIGYFQFGVTA